MKVNDYVRTKEFGINKVKWFDNEEPILENGFTALQSSGYKSSPNIIDLIEVGDYVNGLKVQEVNNEIKGFGKIVFDKDNSIMEDYIYSIVTKEQFKNIEYEVK